MGIPAIPRRKDQGPPRKTLLRARQKVMAVVRKGSQAAARSANYRTCRPLHRCAKERRDLTSPTR